MGSQTENSRLKTRFGTIIKRLNLGRVVYGPGGTNQDRQEQGPTATPPPAPVNSKVENLRPRSNYRNPGPPVKKNFYTPGLSIPLPKPGSKVNSRGPGVMAVCNYCNFVIM